MSVASSILERDAVVVTQFFTGMNITTCMDRQLAIFVFDAFAIRLARMIDPSSTVAAHSDIDNSAIAQLKQKRVIRICRIAIRLNISVALADASPAILDNLGPFRIVQVANTPRP
jgi:hypothetical protein